MRASFSLWKWRTGGSGVAEELSAVFRLIGLGWALQTRLVLSESCYSLEFNQANRGSLHV